jgi:hypothetical protein
MELIGLLLLLHLQTITCLSLNGDSCPTVDVYSIYAPSPLLQHTFKSTCFVLFFCFFVFFLIPLSCRHGFNNVFFGGPFQITILIKQFSKLIKFQINS